jgi:myo-inositol 2-dehydrogenase / D-chiro-inositol 1-dehydrogenase
MITGRPVRVGLVGSAFISTIHAEALKRVARAELFGVCSPTGTRARDFARQHGVKHSFTSIDDLLATEVDMIVLGCPNDLHAEFTEQAARAGKHVVCEKPLARTLAEADRMIHACHQAGVLLMYAEELCFTPKYVRLKRLVDEGALGRIYMVKQCEKHDGPHSAWFYDVQRSGGGVTLDMGCHAFEFFRWMLGKPRVRLEQSESADRQTQLHESPLTDVIGVEKANAISVYADMDTVLHRDKTVGEDHAVILIRFETNQGEALGVAEESWAKKGGMDDTAEVYGTDGVAYADLLQGNSILAYSDTGYSYAVEKAGTTRGWSFCTFEELWNYGFPQEFAHFVDCVADNAVPLETGEDGRAVLEMVLAAYRSAGEGRKITLPTPDVTTIPHALWKPSAIS